MVRDQGASLNGNAHKWVEALRSGRYRQAQNMLRRKTGTEPVSYCCLGVACLLYAKETNDKTVFDANNVLPRRVRDWLGLRTQEGGRGQGRPTLLVLNDKKGATFKEIADIIETDERLFKGAR